MDQISTLVSLECKYTGIIDCLFDMNLNDATVAENFGLTQQAINRYRYKLGARRTMRDFDLGDVLIAVDSGRDDASLMEEFALNPTVIIMLRNRHLMGTMTDFKLGKKLSVGYTHITHYRMKLGIPAYKVSK
jgi:hypothetical protein